MTMFDFMVNSIYLFIGSLCIAATLGTWAHVIKSIKKMK